MKKLLFLAPATKLRKIHLLFGPLAATLLNIPHKVTQGHSRRQFNKHVNMVANSIDAIKATATAFNNRPNITVKMFARFIRYSHLTAIGINNHMIYGTDCTHNYIKDWVAKVVQITQSRK